MSHLPLSLFSSLAILISLKIVACDSTEPFARFEYKHSFKGPFLTQKDGTIPFWEHGGHAIAGDSYIRLTPSMPGKKGYIWSKKLGEFANFRIDVAMKINGRGRLGGDGLAIWYVQAKPDPNVDQLDVFGSKNGWSGLGLLFDSYDNDGRRDNPKIGGFVGASGQELKWKHDTDGAGQDVGHCVRDYRNRPFPVRVRIQYLHKRLKVSVNNGITAEDNQEEYEECFSRDGVELPAKGYFGVTAATGGVSDDMDVLSFVVHSLTDKQGKPGAGPSEADRLKYEKEYDEYSKKLKEQIDAISKGHKQAAEGSEAEVHSPEKEDEAARQFRQVWEEQAHMRSQVNGLSTALAGAKQELLAGVASLSKAVESLRSDLQRKSAGSSGGDAYALKELKDSVGHLAEKVEQLSAKHTELSGRVQQRAAEAPPPPPAPACATPFVLYAALLLQTGVLCLLAFLHARRQEAAKKFY